MALSPEQIADFREEGFFSLGRIFDDREMQEIRAEYARCTEAPMKVGEPDKSPFDYAPLLHLRSPVLRGFATSPRLAEVSVALLGPEIRLYWDQAVAKPAGADSAVPWHQDNGYAPVDPIEYVTYTVAIDVATEENGCLWILPGSHQAGVQPHQHEKGEFFYRGDPGDVPGVACPQPVDTVLAFSSLTMHRSGPNRTDGPRRSWIIQHCVAETRHAATGELLDDRLWIARDGKPLETPTSERPFDVKALIDAVRENEGDRA